MGPVPSRASHCGPRHEHRPFGAGRTTHSDGCQPPQVPGPPRFWEPPRTGSPRARWNQGHPGQERKERRLLHLFTLFKAVMIYRKWLKQVQLLSFPRSRSPCRIHSGAKLSKGTARPGALTPACGKPPPSPGTGGGTAWPGSGRGLRSSPSPSAEARWRSWWCFHLLRTPPPLAAGATPPLSPAIAGLATSEPL